MNEIIEQINDFGNIIIKDIKDKNLYTFGSGFSLYAGILTIERGLIYLGVCKHD
jgi:hypothetical protein